jgi:hypothetical protein
VSNFLRSYAWGGQPPQRDENREAGRREVEVILWYCESDEELDPEPQVYQKMSPPKGEHAREMTLQDEVHDAGH